MDLQWDPFYGTTERLMSTLELLAESQAAAEDGYAKIISNAQGLLTCEYPDIRHRAATLLEKIQKRRRKWWQFWK